MKFDMRHGGAWDRGSADAYYRRAYRPHYFVGATGSSEEITEDRMVTAANKLVEHLTCNQKESRKARSC
jgi:hypothetical protein